MSAQTISVFKIRRGWLRLLIFDTGTKGLTTYRLPGKQAVRDKLAALRKFRFIE